MSPQSNGQSGGSADRRNGEDVDRTLNTWKDIADFLGVSVRTAHRWEEDAGMPVHRAPSGHVCAVRAELDRWRRPAPARRWRRWLLPGALALVGVAIVASLFLLWHSRTAGIPTTVRFEGDTVVALDAGGRRLWAVTIANLGQNEQGGWHVSSPDHYLVSDIDDDGAVEVVVNASLDYPAEGTGRLICYSQDGRVRWEFASGRHLKDRYGEYARSYNVHILRAVRVGGRSFLLSIAAHRLWHPCQVALLDPSTGKIVEEFWHPGAITHALLVDLDRDGAGELVLAGLNNPGPGPGSPVLMVLRLPFSSAQPAAGSLLADMSSGGPTSYVILPRPDVMVAQGGLATIYRLESSEPGTFVAHANYSVSHSAANNHISLSYQFNASLRLQAFFGTVDMTVKHDALWRAGELDHPFSDKEEAWLQEVRYYAHVPNGNTEAIPPFRPDR